ncbi:MAG: GNAT family N-acetyltransferase [Bacteroidetes bacterium HGW-Bacteroidetes-22]|nr:MAG: GNAT family N-acetyltransferase [Bacteroidetes bacterium HGW-Bacteroidetes-22]
MEIILQGCLIRPFQSTDAIRMAELANNEKVAHNLRDGFPSPYTIDNAYAWLKMVEANQANIVRAIEIEGQFAGSVGLHACQDVYRFNLELGYWLGEPYWNRGIMTQVVRAMVKVGFNEMKAHRIFAGIFSFNKASVRVLGKCGFRHEATLIESVSKQGQWADELIFSLRESEAREKGLL